jgi:Fe-S cluster biosynthesis and repair protein YggX
MSNAADVRCRRCGEERPALPRPPFPGPTGAQIHGTVCAPCWGEWERTEVMVINELRLNFMDPEAQQVLERHMREFLALDDPQTAG